MQIEMTKKEVALAMQWIDSASYSALIARVRQAPLSDPWFFNDDIWTALQERVALTGAMLSPVAKDKIDVTTGFAS